MNALENHRTIIMDRGDYTSLTISLLGGRVTSWRIQNREQLFISRIVSFSHLSHIWGGICFSFPHLGFWNFGPHSGFARNRVWSLETGPQYLENGDVWATFFLEDDCYTRALWTSKFKLRFTVTLHEFKLTFDLSVENSDKYFPFDFYFMHHAFFRTPDVEDCEITGLKGALFRVNDKNDDNQFDADILEVETRDVIKITEEIDVLYTKVNEKIVITKLMDSAKLTISVEGMDDFNLWNIWMNHEMIRMGIVLFSVYN